MKDYDMSAFFPPIRTASRTLSRMKLVLFAEKRFDLAFHAHRVNRANLGTLADIARAIASKNPKLRHERA